VYLITCCSSCLAFGPCFAVLDNFHLSRNLAKPNKSLWARLSQLAGSAGESFIVAAICQLTISSWRNSITLPLFSQFAFGISVYGSGSASSSGTLAIDCGSVDRRGLVIIEVNCQPHIPTFLRFLVRRKRQSRFG